jgi:hypothetical protein
MMSRMTVARAVGSMLTLFLIACSRASSPGETQAGADEAKAVGY